MALQIVNDLQKTTPSLNSDQKGALVEQLVNSRITQRRKFERRWYDNNFFDDGYHFRVISRKTGRVIDTVGKLTGFVERTIPRASLQIRGVSNLLFATEPYPVVYPARVDESLFIDKVTRQINKQLLEQQQKFVKEVAKKQGMFLERIWEDNSIDIKLMDMLLLAAKNSISFLKVYTDNKGVLHFDVRDAFDIIMDGDKRSLNSCPFITDTEMSQFEDLRNDTQYDEANRAKLTPDNKYATSEIKDAYMRARFGTRTDDNRSATIMKKETFMWETLTDENWKKISKATQNNNNVMAGKNRGDKVMNHVHSAGGVTLLDEYIDYDQYPYAYLRLEPGPLYQVPLIERFIPQNKSLDIIMTRMEKFVNSMVTGVYQKRKGENFQISNFPGGQVVEYETTPLAQMNISSPGATPFNMIDFLDKFMDEQGASTSALSKVPAGVKSGNAIESLKASEYANLKIPTKMLKSCIKRIAELTLERSHKDMMEPQQVEYLQDGEPQYFDVIGQRGLDASAAVNKPLPSNTIPIKKDLKVRIEIEPGLGLTMEGKRNAMKDIMTFLTPFVDKGYVQAEPLKIAIKKMMETYGFGSTAEFMSAIEEQGDNVTEDTLQKMKIAVLETMKDAGAVGPEADNRMVDTTKVGVLEALKESGLAKSMGGDGQPAGTQKISESMSYKDAPPSIQRQMESAAGFTPATTEEHAAQQKKMANEAQPKPIVKPGQGNGKANP